jgi:hypothetical protein
MTDLEQAARLIIINAHMVWRSCAVGNPAPAIEERYNRISNPKPGQLVAETSLRSAWDKNPLDSIGRLIVTREELMHGDKSEDAPLIQYWYIETLDGRLSVWNNCNFIAVSDQVEPFSLEETDAYFLNQEKQLTNWVRAALIRHELGTKAFGHY